MGNIENTNFTFGDGRPYSVDMFNESIRDFQGQAEEEKNASSVTRRRVVQDTALRSAYYAKIFITNLTGNARFILLVC